MLASQLSLSESTANASDSPPAAPTAAAVLLAAWPFGGAFAQDLEPRLYTNVPVGMNFLGAGYAYSEGNVLFDPAVALENAEIEIDGPLLGYGRSIGSARSRARSTARSRASVSTAPRTTKASGSRATSAGSPTRARA